VASRDSTGDLQVELTVRPTLAILPAVRSFVEQALSAVINDGGVAYRLAMATHELLENAFKYASRPQATLRVSVVRETRHVSISLTNESDPERIEDLRRQFLEMAASDPVTYYCDIMRRHARRRDVSRLGLARIQAEGQINLSLTTDGGVVTIKAEPRRIEVTS
jgi:hypothetical protein